MLCAGDVLDNRCRLTAPIATGGMGEVWRAMDVSLSGMVAVRLLRPDLLANPESDRPAWTVWTAASTNGVSDRSAGRATRWACELPQAAEPAYRRPVTVPDLQLLAAGSTRRLDRARRLVLSLGTPVARQFALAVASRNRGSGVIDQIPHFSGLPRAPTACPVPVQP